MITFAITAITVAFFVALAAAAVGSVASVRIAA